MNYIQYWDENIVQGHVNSEIAVVLDYLHKNKKLKINYIDIGANVGKYYDVISQSGISVEKCIMVEASVELYSYMKNKFKNIQGCKIINHAVSDKDGTIRFESNINQIYANKELNRSINLGVQKITNSDSGVDTNMISGESLLTKFVDFINEIDLIKIDTENRDYNILDSMTNVIQNLNTKPFIVLEHNYHNDMSEENARRIYETFIHKCKYTGLPFDQLHGVVYLTPQI